MYSVLHARYALALLALSMMFLNCSSGREPQSASVAFDPQVWRAANTVRDDARLRMYDDLTARYQLAGHDVAYVTELLGDPTERITRDSTMIWEYRLGRGPGSGIDSFWLQLVFDPQTQVVQRVSRVTD